MTQAQFAAYIRNKTRTDATTFTDAEILSYANVIKDDIAKEVSRVNEDYFGIEVLRSLIAGKRNYGFPSYLLGQIKYLQAKLDGTNWKRLDEFDVNTYEQTTDETSILANWAGLDPAFDIFGGEVMIYSDTAIINVTNGLKLWAIIYPADLSALSGTSDMSLNPTTTTFGMPRQLHKVWADKVIIEYKNSQDKPIPLTDAEKNIKNDLEDAISSLKGMNLDRTIVPSVPYNDGSDY
jgi:hypothetical protein